MTSTVRRRATVRGGVPSGPSPGAAPDPAPLAAAAFRLSAAGLVGLSLLVPGYIRPGWAPAFVASGVLSALVGATLLLRRRLRGPGVAAVVLFGDAAILLSAFASADRVGTTAGALLALPTLFTATFLAPRWLAAQSVVAAVAAAAVVTLVPAPPLVDLIRTAVLVVACVCPAVIVALLRAHLDRAVLTDPLTGLLNRRGLVAGLPAQVARARRAGHPVAVLLVDIDHFKAVNDEHGHVVGDEVLRVVAAAAASAAGPDALTVRFGGEELAVVLAAPEGRVVALAEAVRRQVADAAGPWRVTVSIGTAWAPATEGGGQRGDRLDALLDTLLGQADDRLYEAKRAGRDRAVHPGPVTPRAG